MINTRIIGSTDTPVGTYDIDSGCFVTVTFNAAGQVRQITQCEIIVDGIAVATGVTADFTGDNPSISPQTICALIPYHSTAQVKISHQPAGTVIAYETPLGFALEQ